MSENYTWDAAGRREREAAFEALLHKHGAAGQIVLTPGRTATVQRCLTAEDMATVVIDVPCVGTVQIDTPYLGGDQIWHPDDCSAFVTVRLGTGTEVRVSTRLDGQNWVGVTSADGGRERKVYQEGGRRAAARTGKTLTTHVEEAYTLLLNNDLPDAEVRRLEAIIRGDAAPEPFDAEAASAAGKGFLSAQQWAALPSDVS
jgi:hypothetical protein